MTQGLQKDIERYFDRLWPLNRSLTGEGNRETLRILSEIIQIDLQEIPCGTPCFDWQVPPEWNVREAWIKDEKGDRVVDFAKNNLHLLGYSAPVHSKLDLSSLKQHLYSLPEQPRLIPYLTSYYQERWGFCLAHDQLCSLRDGEYEVLIDSSLDPEGTMTLADAVLPGKTDREVLFTTYICHPSMANNELSGQLVTAYIYHELKKIKDRRYTYRFIFVPETIGSIYYLSKHGAHLKDKMDAGFVVTCIGDPGNFTYKRSRMNDSLSDRAAELILKQTEAEYNLEAFFPQGSDERQYCSPGFNLPMGSLMRTRYGKFPEYHTSGDNKAFVSMGAMEESVQKYLEIVSVLENNYRYVNTMPYCEPQLGKRGLYPTLGSQKKTSEYVQAMSWILNMADGNNDLIDMANASDLPVPLLIEVKDRLLEKGLLEMGKVNH